MPLARELLDEARRRERLQLALLLVLELPARDVVDEDERPERLGRGDLGDGRRAGEVGGARRHVQVDLVHPVDRPAAPDRGALAVLALHLVRDVLAVAGQVEDLVVLVRPDRLDERKEVGPQLAQAVDQDPPAVRPVASPAPEVQREDAQATTQRATRAARCAAPACRRPRARPAARPRWRSARRSRRGRGSSRG